MLPVLHLHYYALVVIRLAKHVIDERAVIPVLRWLLLVQKGDMEDTFSFGLQTSEAKTAGLTNQQVEQLIAAYGERIPISCISSFREMLQSTTMSYSEVQVVLMQMKDPIISLVLSIVVGYLGVGRFYVGDIGLGVIKLITCGGLYVWWLVDIFTIMGKTRMRNYEQLSQILQ